MKETKIEKLILDLSTRWDCSPQEAVDRLNSMNESEINKLINSMTKKFKNGGMIDCLRKGGSIKDCGCGSKIEKAQRGNPDLGKYHLQLSNGNNYSLSGYGLNPQRTVETLTTPEDVITRTIERGDTTVTRNGQSFAPTMRFHQNFDEMKEKAILANKGQDYLDYKKRTGTFDEGGKVRGGNWRDYHTIINAPGDTLRFKQYYSGPAYMQTHPEGGVTYERSTRDGVTRMYNENYKPSWWELNVLGYQPVTAEEKENWQQLIKNHANDPAVKDKTQKKACGGSIEKAQDGATLTRRDAINVLRNKGFSRSQARLAYQNQKNALRNQGFSGNEMRQAARRNVMGISAQPVVHKIPVESAIVNVSTPLYKPEVMSTRQESDYGHLMSKRANAMAMAEGATRFGDAFNIARKNGLQTFRWKGQDFSTETREERDRMSSLMNRLTPQSNYILPDVKWPKPVLPERIDVIEEEVNEEPLYPISYFETPVPTPEYLDREHESYTNPTLNLDGFLYYR